MPRFVFENYRNKHNQRVLYDTRRGRRETIGEIDDAYVPLLERMFRLIETYDDAEKLMAAVRRFSSSTGS